MITVLEIGFLGGPLDGLTFAYTSGEDPPGHRIKEMHGGNYVLRVRNGPNQSNFCYIWEYLNLEKFYEGG